MECPRKKHLVKDLNDFIICKLCHGYLVDATTLVECLHTFCRGCILRHFESSKNQTQCPVCPVFYKKKSQCFRSDAQIQSLVYKAVPSLYFKEMQRREDFYRSTGVRAGSSCSDDSVIDRERDMMHEPEEIISQYVSDKNRYFNQEELISLSLEYYQAGLDTAVHINKVNNCNNNNNKDLNRTDTVISAVIEQTNVKGNGQLTSNKAQKSCDKRYLQCPAGVSMRHLQKFVRMKYGLTSDHKVDIIYKGEVLRNDYSLMDVAYIFHWKKTKPLRLFYRIFTPQKIKPIKIVNTPTATGGKQLQIVPITNVAPIQTSAPPLIAPKIENSLDVKTKEREETESEQQDKERLMANLQLQSKTKALQNVEANKKVQVPEKVIKECVFEYEEPDQEEIKRFAEKRDREWALQKKLEEETKADREYVASKEEYSSKKRKKNKHSKNESNGHKEKKRKVHADKIHAEITNNDKSDLKLKVKITTNGHKYKHHKIDNGAAITDKDKLLKMRQIRHKHMSSSGEERSPPAIPTIKLPKTFANNLGEPEAKRKKEEYPNKNVITQENNNKPLKPRIEPMIIKPAQKPVVDSRTIPSLSKVMPQNVPKSNLKATFDQKTFLKTPAISTDKHLKDQKVVPNKTENVKSTGQMSNKVLPIGSIMTNNKNLDRKIASLQQRCTIEPKNHVKDGKTENKTKSAISPQYPPGFTVSKVESGIKRKAEEQEQDSRPSLEITLIPPPVTKAPEMKPTAKRPPPGTIPLEKIKNAVNLKSGISIIPKIPSDTAGVLDLSKSNKSVDSSPRSSPKTEPINGLNSMINRQLGNMTSRPMSSPGRATPENKNMQLSNLQMLSKVASEHPTLNKLTPNNVNKVRPQIPNLQTIGKISPNIRPPPFQRLPPKLNDIQKFKPTNLQIRSLRPNQNQNIRNIPNPSLILNRHQNLNQNKMVTSSSGNSTTQATTTVAKVSSPKTSPVPPVSSTTNGIGVKETTLAKTAVLEQKTVETKETTD